MKRRTFIQVVGASALAIPFTLSQLGPGLSTRNPVASGRKDRQRLRLALSAEEAQVASVLQDHAEGVYLLGGGVLSRAAGHQPPYLNFLVEGHSFPAAKQALFRQGVRPISTAELPEFYARFAFGEQMYSVINMDLPCFLEKNALSKTAGLIPFAHNFLVYSTREQWVLDPFGGLETPRRPAPEMKIIQAPKSPAVGLEHCLAATFDSTSLGFALPADYTALEERVLNSTASPAEAPRVVEQVINYFPDLVELRGLEATRKYLLSPLCRSAASASAGVDLRRVDGALAVLRAQGTEISGVQLLAAINREFRRREKVQGLGVGYTDYMMVSGFPIRRTDLMVEALRA